MKTFQDLLKKLQACSEAIEWSGEMTVEEVVNTCHRGDWLLWLAKKVNIDNRKLTLAKGHCANTVRHLMKDERSIVAVDAAIAYGEGRIGEDELATAANAAYAAYNAASTHAASTYATFAAAAASIHAASIHAASNASFAAAAASSNAAAAASNVATFAAAAYVEKENRLQTANICREVIGQEIIDKVNELLK